MTPYRCRTALTTATYCLVGINMMWLLHAISPLTIGRKILTLCSILNTVKRARSRVKRWYQIDLGDRSSLHPTQSPFRWDSGSS